jgi:hypothetical protein
MNLKKVLLAATVLALPVAAQAQPVTGLYLGAGAGLNFLQESDVSISGGNFPAGSAFRAGQSEPRSRATTARTMWTA